MYSKATGSTCCKHIGSHIWFGFSYSTTIDVEMDSCEIFTHMSQLGDNQKRKN